MSTFESAKAILGAGKPPKRHYLHIGFNFSAPIDRSIINKEFDSARDWIRYSPDCWILYTALSPSRWRQRLLSVPEIKKHSFFICKIDIDESDGFLPNHVWKWIEKERT